MQQHSAGTAVRPPLAGKALPCAVSCLSLMTLQSTSIVIPAIRDRA
jgi:hypothetical protein